MTPEFKPFPKIGRWANNKIAITEKIDGTNGSIDLRIEGPDAVQTGDLSVTVADPTAIGVWEISEAVQLGLRFNDPMGPGFPEDSVVVLRAGSRNRWLTRSAAIRRRARFPSSTSQSARTRGSVTSPSPTGAPSSCAPAGSRSTTTCR